MHVNEEVNEVDNEKPNISDCVAPCSVSSPTISLEDVEYLLNGHATLPKSWILLDNCSSTDLISNSSLLHGIHTVDHSIYI